MSIDNNSECVKSKYFTGPTDMDESLSDFQEAKKSCKGPKPAQKPVKPKTRKVTKRIKGQNDIRTALKGKKNELVSYSKEFDTVCKKSGLDVDSEQLQLAIALSKSLKIESNIPESSQALSSRQRAAKIRKTLQEYGFKVPEAKISVGKKTKKYRKNYKLLTVTEEERHQNITGKYTRILFENLDHSKVEQDNSKDQESTAKVFYIASNIPYERMRDNNIFYVNNLVGKSTTNGSLLRDWSEIPGRPESPKLIDTFIMNFKDIDCSQDELDIMLSGPIKCVKDIFASKEIEYKMKYKECDVPKIVIEDEVKVVSANDDDNDPKVNIAENKSPSQKRFNMDSPVKMFDVRSPVKRLFDDNSLVCEEIEIISPTKQAIVNSPSKEGLHVETGNKLTFSQQCRSGSPDIFDDEVSSIMETTKHITVLSQEHKTKVFSQEIMDLTQGAIIPSQNSEKGIQLSQNITKRRSNDFMEITNCIVGSSRPICEDLKEIDLTQSPEKDNAILEGDYSFKVDNVSINLCSDAEKNGTDSISQNITDEQLITVLSKQPNTDSHQTAKENIDLTQSSNEDDKGTLIEENIRIPVKNTGECMDLTQSPNSSDISLPLVDVRNSQSQESLDGTIIVDKDDLIANGKLKKYIFGNEAPSQIYDLTQAQDASIEYNPSPVKVGNRSEKESCSISFYEDFVHDHSENTENSKEIEQQNTNMSKEDNNSSHTESKESNEDIDLTQGSSTSEEMLMSQRPMTVLEDIPNNSSLGKQNNVSIDYDEIITEDNTYGRENEKDSSLIQQYNSPKSEFLSDIEIVDENNDFEINSSQNSEVFQISDKELDYSLHKSRHDFRRDNLDFTKGREKDKIVNLKYDASKSKVHNNIEIVDEINDIDFNSSQNSEVFQIAAKENFEIVKGSEKDKSLELKCDSSKSEGHSDIEILDENNDIDINSSQHSEVFNISDNELDYSLHKSRHDFPSHNIDFGGISVSKLGSHRKSLSEGCEPYFTENKNDTVENSFLPEVYVKKTESKILETALLEIEKTEVISVIKSQDVLRSHNGIINIKTPKNSEYIIKTHDVTPMADFASMSTPQRNRELDRYGLKPFKRKRAIQILTHLYNQTHPTIQQLVDEDQPSASKKPRTNAYTQEYLPQKHFTSPVNSPTNTPVKFVNVERLHVSPKKTDVLNRNRDVFSAPSPIKPDEMECNINILSPPSVKRKACSQTQVESPRKFVYKKPSYESRLHVSSRNTDVLDRNRDIFGTPSPIKPDDLDRDTYNLSPPFLKTKECSQTQVESPRKFVYKKPSYETIVRVTPRQTDELDRNRDIFSAPSPIKLDELERNRNILSPPSPKRKESSKIPVKSPRKFVYKKPTHGTRLQTLPITPNELERDSNTFSASSSSKTDEIKGVTDVCGYEVTSEVAVVKCVDCTPDDWVFQKREKAKVHSCRVPLHIAFHNYVLSRRSLREAILKYEPVNIDVIHKDLVGYGHRYDPKDLLKFLDKKCITVKTTDNNARNNKR